MSRCLRWPVSASLFIGCFALLTSSAAAQTSAESEETARLETRRVHRRLDDVARQKIAELFDPAKRPAAVPFFSAEEQTWQRELGERTAEVQDAETAGAFADVIHSLEQGYRGTPSMCSSTMQKAKS